MGVVYEAEQLSLGRTVALKILPFAAVMEEKTIKRFRNEARAAAALDHPRIVPVYAVSTDRDVHFYAMALIEGLTLSQVIEDLQRRVIVSDPQGRANLSIDQIVSDRDKSATSAMGRTEPTTDYRAAAPESAEPREISPSRGESAPESGKAFVEQAGVDAGQGRSEETSRSEATRLLLQSRLSTKRSATNADFFRRVALIGAQAAEALHYAHEHGIVHRDVQPGDLMLDVAGKLWVTNLGLAQFESDPGMTMTGDLVGTVRYMSPEQALCKRVLVDHRTDIYSLGVTLSELLTLQSPFSGESRAALLRQIAFDEPVSPRRLNASIPVELSTIVLKAIEKNPQERYATAQELADDLRHWLEDKAIKRGVKWARRNRALVNASLIAGVMVFAALIVGTTVSVWQAVRATQAQERADANAAHAIAEQRKAVAEEQKARAAEERTEERQRESEENLVLAQDSIGALEKLVIVHW